MKHEFYLDFRWNFLHISSEMETEWISDATSETQTEQAWANRSDELGRNISNFNGPAQRLPSLPSVSHRATDDLKALAVACRLRMLSLGESGDVNLAGETGKAIRISDPPPVSTSKDDPRLPAPCLL